MKSTTALLCGALALAGSTTAAPPVLVYGEAFYNDQTLVLNVYADSSVELRSFGIRIGFDSALVSLVSVKGNGALWFISAQPGQRSPYDSTQAASNAVRIVGARFHGNRPSQGVSGSGLLLATLIFERVSLTLPSFQLDLAGPYPYASFVTVDGSDMDSLVYGLGALALSFEPLPEDSDGDGIPDPVEIDWFGTLTRANATSDSDGDGSKDIEEWICGTHAGDSNSVTRLEIRMQSGGDRLIQWTGQTGRVYDLLWAGDLTNFFPFAEGITPADPTSILDSLPAAAGYYRLLIHYPSSGE